MATLQQYKCPCCDGGIEFSAEAQKLKCPYCDTEFELEALKGYSDEVNADQDDSMDWSAEGEQQWQEGETEGMRVYACQSCGGEIVGDATTAATSCPFCGNPVVMTGQFAGDLRPDCVIPFKLDKQAAKDGMLKHFKGKKLLPPLFKQNAVLEEIKGIYVPFWIFDTQTDASIRYKATRTRHWSDSNYNYTETSHYSVVREGTLAFANVPADGSSKMPDDVMESIEPYDLREAVDFNTAFLSGFFADRYDVTAQQNYDRVNKRVKTSTEEALRATVHGYTTVMQQHSSVKLTDNRVRYALLPVWVLTASWNENKYTFAMNGQTGKFVGNLPVDKGLYAKWLGLISGISAALTFGVTSLIWLANIL